MTTINCASNCIHQKDGFCTLDNITIKPISNNTDCVFFQNKEKIENPPFFLLNGIS